MRFFFYGTLQTGSRNPVAQQIHARLLPEGPATIAGRLHALPDPDGWYPALSDGTGIVHGQVFRAGPDFTTVDLAMMDRYEDFDPANPLGSLYLRQALPLLDGRTAEVYRFNRPLPDRARRIPGGDFRQWLAETGLPEFGG